MQIRLRSGAGERWGDNLRVPPCRDHSELASGVRTRNAEKTTGRIPKNRTCLPHVAGVSGTKHPKSNPPDYSGGMLTFLGLEKWEPNPIMHHRLDALVTRGSGKR